LLALVSCEADEEQYKESETTFSKDSIF
jgi:hypothetical protein